MMHLKQAVPARQFDIYRNHDQAPLLRPMTDLLEKAVAAARELPPEAQDDIARVILMLAQEEAAPVPLSAEERNAIAASKAAAARGEFATDEQVRALWSKHGL